MQDRTTLRLKLRAPERTIGPMAGRTPASSEYTDALHDRMRAAREAHGLTQADLAKLLGLSRHAYEKYETRSRLPHHLIEAFAQIVGVTIAWLVSGREDIGRRA